MNSDRALCNLRRAALAIAGVAVRKTDMIGWQCALFIVSICRTNCDMGKLVACFEVRRAAHGSSWFSMWIMCMRGRNW